MPHSGVRRDPKIQECIEICSECHDICLETIQYCLKKGGKHAELSHIRLLMNCAEVCQTSANFMLTESEFHQEACRVCAMICERCAESCNALASGDEQMRRCADICLQCAQSCRDMFGGVSQAA